MRILHFALILMILVSAVSAKTKDALCLEVQKKWSGIEAFQKERGSKPNSEVKFLLGVVRNDCEFKFLDSISNTLYSVFVNTLSETIERKIIFDQLLVPCLEECSPSVAMTGFLGYNPDPAWVYAQRQELLKHADIVPYFYLGWMGLAPSRVKRILDSLGYSLSGTGRTIDPVDYLGLTGDSSLRKKIVDEIRAAKGYQDARTMIYRYGRSDDKGVQRALAEYWVRPWWEDSVDVSSYPRKDRKHIRIWLEDLYEKMYKTGRLQTFCSITFQDMQDLIGGNRLCDYRLAHGVSTPAYQARWDKLRQNWERFYKRCLDLDIDLRVSDQEAFFFDSDRFAIVNQEYLKKKCPHPVQ
jgi:hypothetical protein